jgi:hypothetical protein
VLSTGVASFFSLVLTIGRGGGKKTHEEWKMKENGNGTERGREVLWNGNGEVLKNTIGWARCAAGVFISRVPL